MNGSLIIGFHDRAMDLLDDEDAQEIVDTIAYLEKRVELLEEQLEQLKLEINERI